VRAAIASKGRYRWPVSGQQRLRRQIQLELRADQGQRSAPNRRNRRLDPHFTAICSIRRASIVGPQEPQVAACLGRGCDSRHFATLEKINKINVLNGVFGAP
jgi:hypothetical protein